ncbi:MAG: stage IV sporulation protein A [Clostridia bacterium]|nr:stage IV sporulation protein A [Clostridia bacterium]
MNVLKDIAKRTGGDIYIGVVGPVRTGKSTFIKRFMDLMVLPNMKNSYDKERLNDELPQSSQGKTIMTTEPKFIPNEAALIDFCDNGSAKIRMIDCVGYVIPDSLGYEEDGNERMVHTPWSEEEIPFIRAAEIGTKKVICEHSTIGLVVTTDGTVTDIGRESYVEAERRVVSELKEIKKPFVVVVNSRQPKSTAACELCDQLAGEYGVPVVCADCAQITEEEILALLKTVLYEFPISEVGFSFPKWIRSLEQEHPLKKTLFQTVHTLMQDVKSVRDVTERCKTLEKGDLFEDIRISSILPGEGSVTVSFSVPEKLFYDAISETTGIPIDSDDTLMSVLKELSLAKAKFDRMEYALNEVKEKGYGIVYPDIEELTLEEPEIIRQGNKYGVCLKASAPSIHMIRADIQTEVSPIVGTEKQSEDLVKYLLSDYEEDPKKIWESNIFGKSLHELINEGLQTKLSRMPEDARGKLKETLTKIINEGSGGLICIIL